MDDKDNYWAANKDAEKFAEAFYGKAEALSRDPSLAAITGRLSKAYLYYYGMDESGRHLSMNITRGGEVGELAELRVNHARSLVTTAMNLVLANKVTWEASALTTDYRSLREAELANAILDYYWKDRYVAQKAEKQLESAFTAGEGFVHLRWNYDGGESFAVDSESEQEIKSGDLVYDNVQSWDVIRDPFKDSWDSLDWVGVHARANKFTLAAAYPEVAKKILNAAVVSERFGRKGPAFLNNHNDEVSVFYFYHRRTPALPQGREVCFVSPNIVLHDIPLSWSDFPLVRTAAAEVMGTPFAYTPFFEVIAMQELYDNIVSSLATNLSTFAIPIIVADHGSELEPQDTTGGPRLLYVQSGMRDPRAVNLTASPPEAYKMLDMLKAQMEFVFGLNAIVRGEPMTGDQSGAALSLLDASALRQMSQIHGNHKTSIEKIGALTIECLQKRLTAPQKIALVGKTFGNLVEDVEYTGQDISNIKLVRVDTGNPLLQSTAGKFQVAQQLLQMNMLKTPEQFFQIINTGSSKPMTEGLTSELMYIKAENEALMRGEVPPVLNFDSHSLHAPNHRVVLNNIEARKDPKVVEAVITHIAMHHQEWYNTDPTLLLMMREQPPPPPAPPPPPPGAPPPGAEGGAPPGPGGPPPPPSGASPSGAPLPNLPTNPATGNKWNPENGGGSTPIE